jgi:hypothetical protein
VDLNVLLNFSFGAYVYDSTYASLMAGFETPGDQLIKIYKIVGNNQVTLPMFLCFDSNNDFNSQSTRFLFNNDYVRLKALNLGIIFLKMP